MLRKMVSLSLKLQPEPPRTYKVFLRSWPQKCINRLEKGQKEKLSDWGKHMKRRIRNLAVNNFEII